MSEPVRHLAAAPDPPWADEYEFLRRAQEHIRLMNARRSDNESLQLIKAVRLAPTLPICEALLRGEHVPRSQLDPEWLRRYGL